MLAHDTLTDSMLREGPSADGKNAQAFLDKWNEAGIVRPFIRDGKWYAVVPRQYTSAEDMVKKEIAQAGVGKNVPLDSLKVLDHDTAVKECDRLLLSELLDPREAWEN
jgi:tRNA nucleotidyltransferase (CCA-adding enzyme)